LPLAYPWRFFAPPQTKSHPQIPINEVCNTIGAKADALTAVLESPLIANTGQHRYGMIAMDLKVIWEMSIHTNHGK